MKSLVKANLLVALGYCLGGYIGHLLAISPAYVTPIWPAAGVALVALLLRGKQVLPGLVLGVVVIQFYSFIGEPETEQLVYSLLVAAGIGLGSILQAGAGACLIRRYVGETDPLIEEQKIARFLLLGGPLSCIIAPTFGSLILLLAGLIDSGGLPFTWAIWWLGDSLGVLILAPILMILFARPRHVWAWRIKSVVLPMSLLLLGVMLLFHFGYKQEWQRIAAEYRRQMNIMHLTLTDEIKIHENLNHAMKAFYDSSTEVTERDFNNFAGAMLDESAGIFAIEWIPRVPHEQRPQFETDWRDIIYIREPGTNDSMMPAATREEYFPIRYLVPYEGNERALGFDISNNPVALETARQARDSGRMAATPPIKLVQDPDGPDKGQNGTVLYAPVYGGGISWDTVEQRRRHLKGFVANVFRISDSIDAILNKTTGLQLNLIIHSNGDQLYNSTPLDGGQNHLGDARLKTTQSINVADKSWEVIYTPSDGFYEDQLFWNLWWLLLSGFLITAFTGTGLLMLTGQTLRTEDLVRKRTRELEFEGQQRQRIIDIMEMQNEILQAIVGTESLQGVLNLIANLTEMSNPDMICSILLVDQSGKQLRVGSAPSLPSFYRDALDGLEIGEGAGSSGTAAWSGETVIVGDVTRHPYWKNFRELARKAGLRASWSEPILSGDNVLGVFSLYYSVPKKPDENELRLIRDLARIASIAIEQKLSESRIQRLAFYDTLTDLPNRRLLLDRLQREIAICRRYDSYGAVLFIDLDNFKILNDSLGHQVGDQLLKQAAGRLRHCIREEDTAARHGGDEFVILMRASRNDLDAFSGIVHGLAKRIQNDLSEPYNLDGYEHHISASVGISFFSKESKSPDEILKQADTAMYSAKAHGRNTLVFYHPEMQEHVDKRLQMEISLRAALDKQQFTLLYQPQYDNNLRIIGAEALIRWSHPDKGLIAPDEFIPLAEENKMIMAIGDWVLETACKQLQEWPELDYISINISPVQIKDGEFIERTRQILQPYAKDVRRLMMEMTEGIMIENAAEAMQIIHKLQAMGIGISIDDFGKGYSSLVYLKSLPLNQIKVDKGFVEDIGNDQNGEVIVETIIAMARHLQLDVIAEGVESEIQFAFLRGQGCHKFQGYYFSHPLSGEQFDKLLQENHKRSVRG